MGLWELGSCTIGGQLLQQIAAQAWDTVYDSWPQATAKRPGSKGHVWCDPQLELQSSLGGDFGKAEEGSVVPRYQIQPVQGVPP